MLVLACLICFIKAFDFRSINNSFDGDLQPGSETVFDLQTDSPTKSMEGQCNRNESSNAQDNDDFVKSVFFINKGSQSVDDSSDFCLHNSNSLKGYRAISGSDLKCQPNASISNVLMPIQVYNITLLVFYDKLFEKKSRDVITDLKYLVKGLQESFTTYDVINEIGLIKFYVDKVNKIRQMIHLPLELIDTDKLRETFWNYIVRSQKIVISPKAISIWFTRADLIAYEKKSLKFSFKRVEGIANCDRFCETSYQLVLVNCNSLNKAVITLSHEIGKRFQTFEKVSARKAF